MKRLRGGLQRKLKMVMIMMFKSVIVAVMGKAGTEPQESITIQKILADLVAHTHITAVFVNAIDIK
jgi:hypothetical protein